MRYLLFCFMLLVCSMLSFAQDDPNQGFDYKAELERSIPTPQSPEAAAFMKYGDVAVSSYTGSLGYSLPLYTHQGLEMSLPMSLSYNQDIKVSQVATGAGLGWNLNIGGRVSRVVNGLPDNGTSAPSVFDADTRAKLLQYYGQGGVHSNVAAARAFYDWTKDIEKNRVDVFPDYFTVNVMGINETIAFDVAGDMKAKVISNPRIKVTVIGYPTSSRQDISGWIITGEDGTRYYFEKAEQTKYIADDSSSSSYNLYRLYNSSWVLTKIESPTKLDVYTFTYDAQSYGAEVMIAQEHEIANTTLNTNQTTHYANSISRSSPYTSIKQQFLTKVLHNSKTIYDITLAKRYDYRQKNESTGSYTTVNNAIDQIEVFTFDPITNKNRKVQNIDLQHSYFGATIYANNPSSVTGWDHLKIKLKLDAVVFSTAGNQLLKKFSYDYYNPTNVPARNSKSQDYMGYYNAKSNSTLLPKIDTDNVFIDGADRSPNPSASLTGVLKRVTYPTGGYTEFAYENHQVSKTKPMQPEVLGRVSASSGISTFDCRSLCMDKYIQAPVVNSNMIYIEESGTYQIKFTNEGGASLFDAWIIKRPDDNIVYDGFIGWGGGGSLPNSSFIWYANQQEAAYTENHYLAKGYYQMTAAKRSGSARIQIEIIDRHKDEFQNVIEYLPGIRVQSVTDYDNTNEPAKGKEYKYVFETDTLKLSSGIQLYKPTLVSSSNTKVYQSGEITDTKTLVRKTSAAGSPQNHIVYRRVFEYNKAFTIEDETSGFTTTRSTTSTFTFGDNPRGDNDDDVLNTDPIDTNPIDPEDPLQDKFPNGYVITDYYAGSNGIIPDALGNNYRSEYQNGKAKSVRIYDKFKILRSEEKFFYESYDVFSSLGMVFKLNPDNKYLYRLYFSDPGGGIYEGNYPGQFQCIFCEGGQVMQRANPPEICDTNDPNRPNNLVECNLDPDAASKQLIGRSINGRGGYLAKKEQKVYDPAEGVETVTNYSYDPDIDYLLRAVQTTTSTGTTKETKYYYPADYNANNLPEVALYDTNEKTGYNTLYLQNRIAIPIRTEWYVNDAKVYTKSISFKAFNSKGPFPFKSYYAKGNEDMHSPIEFVSYNTVGKPTQVLSYGHNLSKLIYGYGNKQLIAKIDNASATNYALTVSTSLQTNPASLQTHFYGLDPNAMIATYGYNYLGQITTMVDPRGSVMYYEYDTQNRLQYVKDEEGNLISKNQYNYTNH